LIWYFRVSLFFEKIKKQRVEIGLTLSKTLKKRRKRQKTVYYINSAIFGLRRF